MFRIMTLIVAAALVLPIRAGAAMCGGPAPAITSVKVQNVATSDALNHYTLVATVTNAGSQGQASNVIQSVRIFDGAQAVDMKGVPPLAAGQSYQVRYVWPRAVSAGNGSTTFTFRLQTPSAGCATASTVGRVTF